MAISVTNTTNFSLVSPFQATIPEFVNLLDNPEDILFRATHNEGVLFEAREENRLIGLLFAYQEKQHCWYNHITAVSPDSRGKGIATTLISQFETFAKKREATRLTVKSMNRFPCMLRRLIALEYEIIGTEGAKILFQKSMK